MACRYANASHRRKISASAQVHMIALHTSAGSFFQLSSVAGCRVECLCLVVDHLRTIHTHLCCFCSYRMVAGSSPLSAPAASAASAAAAAVAGRVRGSNIFSTRSIPPAARKATDELTCALRLCRRRARECQHGLAWGWHGYAGWPPRHNARQLCLSVTATPLLLRSLMYCECKGTHLLICA